MILVTFGEKGRLHRHASKTSPCGIWTGTVQDAVDSNFLRLAVKESNFYF